MNFLGLIYIILLIFLLLSEIMTLQKNQTTKKFMIIKNPVYLPMIFLNLEISPLILQEGTVRSKVSVAVVDWRSVYFWQNIPLVLNRYKKMQTNIC